MLAEQEIIFEACPPPHIPVDPAVVLPPQPKLTHAQQELYDEVVKHFCQGDYALPDVKDGVLREDEKFWLSCECMLRYLRAIKWSSSHAAIIRLESTLRWRREFGVYDLITASHVEPEAVTGKAVIWGYDVDNRPAYYLFPSRQNTEENIRQIHYVVWSLERLSELMGPGIESLALMINFGDRGKSPSIMHSRTVLNIFQNHYPERLGRALVINVPFLVNAFFKLIMPFVDPLTRSKLRFNPDCLADGLFTPEQLISEWRGSAHFRYEHDKYWEPLVRMCAERRERLWEKWRELGAKVGVREWDVKCAIELEDARAKAAPVSEAVFSEAVSSEVVTNSYSAPAIDVL